MLAHLPTAILCIPFWDGSQSPDWLERFLRLKLTLKIPAAIRVSAVAINLYRAARAFA